MTLPLSAVELVLMLFSALGFSFLLIREPPDRLGALETLILRIAAGLGFLAYLTLAAAAIGWIRLPFFLLVLLSGSLLFWMNRGKIFGIFARTAENFSSDSFHSLPCVLILLLLLLVNLFYSLFPPTFYDSMLYHLAVPAYYLQHGKIVPWPTNFNASVPMTGEMLDLFALIGRGLFVPKLLSFVSGLMLIIWLAASFGRRLFPGHALLAALFFYSIPEVGFLASSSKTDIIGLLFFIIGVRLLLLFLEESLPAMWLAWSGIFFGLAVSSKYIFAFPFAGVVVGLLLSRQMPAAKKARAIVCLGICIILILMPWLAKNWLLTGNPVYPYMNRIFPSANWSSAQGENFSTVIKRGKGWNIWNYLRFPVEMFTKPYKYSITGVYGMLMPLFLPFLFWRGRKREETFLLLAALSSYLLLLLFARVPRYFLSSLLVLAIPLAAALDRGFHRWPVVKNPALIVMVLLAAFNLLEQVDLQETFSKGFTYLSRKVSGRLASPDVPYLFVLPYYPAAAFVNSTLADSDRIAFLGEERTFYFQKPFLASSFNDRNPLVEILRASGNAAEFFRKLRLEKITHILYSPSELERMASLSPGLLRLTPGEKSKLEDFLANTETLYQDRTYRVLKVPSGKGDEASPSMEKGK